MAGMKKPTGWHCLDPLTPKEISAAGACCRAHAEQQGLQGVRFNTITLKEPAKQSVLDYDAGGAVPPRRAFCILQAPGVIDGAIEAVITLSEGGGGDGAVESWAVRDGVQPLATPEDCFDAEAIVKADPEVQALLRDSYGLTDLDLIVCDPWSVHLPPLPGRLIQTFMYARGGHAMDNAYAHPIDFLPIVDLNLKKVVRIDRPYGDNAAPPVPSANINYHRDLCELPPREGLKPLDVVQPEGASWTIDGNAIAWQRWRIRTSFNYREGLVLHNVGYEDGGRVRPILHRFSMVEMAVPYGDPHEPFTRKCAFDVGDYGLGNCTTSLSLGCDCLGNIHYFDAVLNNSKGEPVLVPKAVCMHEEDSGMLWKHVEYRNMHSEVRRSRRLVLSFICTVVNYEYAIYYYFYQDGTIGYEIKLTGELSTNALSPDEEGGSKYGTMVAEGVNAQLHQHLFSVRLDFAVDDDSGGKGLVVSSVDVAPLPQGPDNPAGNGFAAVETPLLTESQAQVVLDASRARYVKVSNPAVVHPATRKPVAWKLLVPPSQLLLAGPQSALATKAAFATKHVWVTRHSDDEKWPAGDYTIQAKGGEGLPLWTKADRACGGEGVDSVVWVTLGATHVPRAEDFPVMPVETVGLTLKPFCFFTGNPGVDLPCAPNAASKLANAAATNGANGTNGAAHGNGVNGAATNGNGAAANGNGACCRH